MYIDLRVFGDTV